MESQTTSTSPPSPCATKKYYCGSRLPQYFAAFVVNLSCVVGGAVMSWPATAIPDINLTANFRPLSSQQVAWITSSSFLGGLAACPLAGYLAQRLGLRSSMLTLALPLLIGWLIIIFSNDVWTIVLARIITGFCSGGMSLAAPAFIAETSIVEIRGMLGYTYDIMFSFGQLYIFGLGSILSWKWQAFACGIIPIIFYFLMMLVPESPKVLVSKNKMEEAKSSLAWFRSAPSINLIEDEFNDICQDLCLEKRCFQLRDYFSSQIIRPTLICIVLLFFCNFTGCMPVLSYIVEIFTAAEVGNSFLATILVGLTQVVAASTSARFVDRLGRRVLLMISTFGMAIMMLSLGGYLCFKELFGSDWSWLPIPLLMVYIVLFSIGLGPIPWVIMGEVIPPGAKGYTSGVIIASFRVSTFVCLFVFNDLVELLGGEGMCFLLFAATSMMAFVYIYFFVPETKQKTLTEIQLLFGRK